MRGQVMSALTAGLASAVIWMVITTALDFGKGAVIGFGLVLLVGVALITQVISTLVARSHTAQRPG